MKKDELKRIELNEHFTAPFVGKDEIAQMSAEIEAAKAAVDNGTGAGKDFLGWRDLPLNYDKEEFKRIEDAAERIKKLCKVFIVIGIGGSYLGARAAIEFIKSPLYNNLPKDTPDVYFAGNSLSANALADLLAICEAKDNDICINVISKSGTTTEPAITFRIFREILETKFKDQPEKIRERIFVTTDRCRGTLREFADKAGFETFVVPDDVGGRYSVTTAVGLLPIAVAGCDIKQIMKGTEEARKIYKNAPLAENACLRYAALRNILYRKGKTTEIFASYEPALQMMGEWFKQLYGESEGKDNKGLFPASVTFSTDLHSLGQYIQEGLRNLFETVIRVAEASEVAVPKNKEDIDGLNYLFKSKKTDINDINKTATIGTLFAHMDGGVPNIVIDIPDRSEKTFGHLVYFFEYACAVSGYLLGVNPFNQPGVEAYKQNMFALLGRPDKKDKNGNLLTHYAETRKKLQKRLAEMEKEDQEKNGK